MGAFLCPLPYQYLVSEKISANCGLKEVIFILALTHPNTPLLASLLDLLGVDLAKMYSVQGFWGYYLLGNAEKILHSIENVEICRKYSV
jgi:hypothetical protein